MDRHLTKRRLAVLGILTLAVGGIKLIEDVVARESGPVDEAILWFIRDHVPAALNGFFAVVTFNGSARFLLPAAVVVALALCVARIWPRAGTLAIVACCRQAWSQFPVSSSVCTGHQLSWSLCASGSSFP
jgi:hypothetical protein